MFYKFVALLSGITLLLVKCADGHMPSEPEPHLMRRIVREERIQPFCVPSWRLLVTSSCVHLGRKSAQARQDVPALLCPLCIAIVSDKYLGAECSKIQLEDRHQEHGAVRLLRHVKRKTCDGRACITLCVTAAVREA